VSLVCASDVSERRLSSPVERYYLFHSKIYDATRWTYLFGRRSLIERIAKLSTPSEILEVGCGTGSNLVTMSRLFSRARITGLDISEAMLAVARKKLAAIGDRVTLLHAAYDRPLRPSQPFDLVVFSYCLTMINPGWDKAIEHAHCDLQRGGLIGVVDFHGSPFALYRRWMWRNHVRLDGHLLPKLTLCFEPRFVEIRPAYAGCWSYLSFVGAKVDL
jgi:S-adenosylmethionine-diacylgycerolhomoserine-N-methlytransferase